MKLYKMTKLRIGTPKKQNNKPAPYMTVQNRIFTDICPENGRNCTHIVHKVVNESSHYLFGRPMDEGTTPWNLPLTPYQNSVAGVVLYELKINSVIGIRDWECSLNFFPVFPGILAILIQKFPFPEKNLYPVRRGLHPHGIFRIGIY